MKLIHYPILSIVALLFIFNTATAQTPQYYKCCGTVNSITPLKGLTGAKTQLWYNPSDFNVLPSNGQITKIYFRSSVGGQSGAYSNFTVSMKQPATGTGFASPVVFESGLTQVHYSPSQTIYGAAITGDWYAIELSNPFTYDNTKPLVVEIFYDYPHTGVGVESYSTASSQYRKVYAATEKAATGNNGSNNWQDFGIDIMTTPCSGTLAPGIATKDVTGAGCLNTPVTLSLSGHTTGIGQTYMWLSAPAMGGPYTPISSPSSSPVFSVAPATTTWYRAMVTCGTVTSTSQPVQVSIAAGFPGGTYTINSAQPTGGTNFQSFGDAISAISCGITGPVVFNVVPNSGPYNEQVIIPYIGGTSATNTVTINGNGNTLTYSSGNVSNRGTIKLVDADYITINNLEINATGFYAYCVQLMYNADNNTIANCTLTPSNVSVSIHLTAGIVLNGVDGGGVTHLGNTRCDNNTITNNTINGGLAGVAIVGDPESKLLKNNKVINNVIKDFYLYGVFLHGGDTTIIEGNDISRPSTALMASFTGIQVANCNYTVVSKNGIHDPFGGFPSSGSSAKGISIINNNSTPFHETLVSNNIFYNTAGGADQVGMMIDDAGNVKAYYNTFYLDDAASTTTLNTKGIWVHTSQVSGLEFKNNIIHIARGGTGEKQALYIDNAATTFTADHNDYYISSSSGLKEIAHLGTTGYSTLAAWQTASGQEANSLSIDPLFTAPATGNLLPSSPAINNLGIPISGIFTDIQNVSRHPSTPDMGAFESSAPVCDTPSALSVSGITYTGATINWNGVTGAVGYQYALTTNATPPASGTPTTATTYNATGLIAGTTYYFHVRTDCGSNNYSIWKTISFTTPTCAAPAGVAASGITYTGATVNWNTVTNAVGYEYALNTNATPPTTGSNTTATTYNATGLSPATKYYFHIRTDCGSNYSLWAIDSFTTPSCNAPAANVTNITMTTADINWNTIAGVVGYEYALTTGTTPPATGTVTTNTTFNATGLSANTNYCFHIRTVCDTGVYSAWTSTCFPTPVCSPPGAPWVTNLTPISGTVNWGAVAGAVGYEYEVGQNPLPPVSGTFTTGTTYNATGLTGKTQYFAHVRTDCGNGNFSTWVTAAFYSADTCLPPVATVGSIIHNSAAISWQPMPHALYYQYKVDQSSTPPVTASIIPATGYIAQGLQPSTQYYVHLRTLCTADTSVWASTPFMTTTSVNSIGNSGARWSVYPNPVNSTLTIEVTGIRNIDAKVKVYDVTGKEIKQLTISKDKTNIDMSGLSQGVYMLKYTDENGSSAVRVVKE